jgi:hypothetical protein
MAKWRWGADDGRCAETRQRATQRDGRPPGTTRTTRTTTRTTTRAGCSWLLAAALCLFLGRRPRHVEAGCCRGWSVGLRAPHPNGLRRRAWPGPATRLAAAPRNPASQQPLPLCAVRPIPPWPLPALSSRCCPALLPCCPAAPSPIPAAKPPSGVKTTSPAPSQPACSCSLLHALAPLATRQPPTPSLSPVAFRPSPFAFRLSPFALRLAPCATLPLRPLPSTLLRCRPCPFHPAPLLKH